ncbi:MAG TPA: M28 family peptidase, partial [Pyrinomonadaceae bacterium]|nr:M28 family peptidase [Pyrinomonadaceae bacterium]
MFRSTFKISAFVFVLLLAGSAFPQKGVDTTPKSTLIDATALLDDIRILSNDDMEGRSAANPSMQKARDYVQRRFRESGISTLNPTYDQEFQIKTKGTTLRGVNFVGIIKGSKNPENYIIMTAHYDHLGIRNGAIYNGADDNASGTAALFALAKAFKKERP